MLGRVRELVICCSTYRLGLYPSRAAYNRFLRAGRDGEYGADVTAGLAQVTFDPVEELPVIDAVLWTEHQLPIAGDQAYPLAMKHLGKGDFERPSKKELTFLEGVLRSLATTSEEEIDSGRWHKEVMTFDGPEAITLVIPDLLKPPTPQEWIRRRYAPDRRAHERAFADMNRYLEEHPPTDDDGFEAISRLFSGRSLDDPLTQPRSPGERARICAFELLTRTVVAACNWLVRPYSSMPIAPTPMSSWPNKLERLKTNSIIIVEACRLRSES